jgi:FkbM family methyltransferase
MYAVHAIDEWIAAQFEEGFQGFAVDVGASDGITASNTFLLEKKGWSVLCIEPSPVYTQAIKQNRMFTLDCACGHESRDQALFHVHMENPEAYSGLKRTNHPVWHADPNAHWQQTRVNIRTLNECLEQSQFPRLDAVSIDTEGTEMDVLRGFDLEKWQPKVMVIESWDEEGPVLDHVKQFGYQRLERRNVNDLFVRML